MVVSGGRFDMSGVAAKRTKWEAEKELAPVVITPIAPAALHDVWDLVRDDLDECRKHDTSTTWMEDIYSSLRNEGWSASVRSNSAVLRGQDNYVSFG